MQCEKKSFFFFLIILFVSCKNRNTSESITINSTAKTPVINYSVTNSFPHDDSLFTEGLLIYNGQLFESTGSPDELSPTKSLIGADNLSTGKFYEKIELDKSKYFGEGISFLKTNCISLLIKIAVLGTMRKTYKRNRKIMDEYLPNKFSTLAINITF